MWVLPSYRCASATKSAHRSGRRDWLSQWTLSLDRASISTEEVAPKPRRNTKVHRDEIHITRHCDHLLFSC